MAGVLLRSGSVKHFLPLGATGNPVYSAASQLRAAMRRQLGQELADYFAIPKQDEKGEIIDWYSAFEGNVVPWTAATPEERSDAKAKLLSARAKLLEKSLALQNVEDSEQQVFGKLLALATRIPGDDHVYLVDGRPVMTFWGFSERQALSDQDVLAGLDTERGWVRADESSVLGDAVGVTETTAIRSRWRFWPWLLPLLLLLLLWLWLFGLRSCGVGSPPPIEPDLRGESAPVIQGHEAPEGKTDADQDAVKAADGSDARSIEGGNVDGNAMVDRVDRSGVVTHSGSSTGKFDGSYDESRSSRDAVDQHRSDTETVDTADRADTETTAADRSDTATTDDTADAGATDAESDAAADQAATDGDEDQRDGDSGDKSRDTSPDGKQTDESRQAASRDRDGNTVSRSDVNAKDAGKPLEIPRDAARKGSTEFMNGNWRSVTGLQDAAGNPVQLEYEFKGGQGTATLRRTVGGREQECTAAVRPTFKGSKLVIDQPDDIRCPDGSTFQRSSVECTTNAKGRAECKGKNRDGSDYQVKINKK